MSKPVSIMDSPLWINGESGHPYIFPAFKKGFNLFLTLDRFGGPFLVNSALTLDKWYFAFADPGELPVASPVARTAPVLVDCSNGNSTNHKQHHPRGETKKGDGETVKNAEETIGKSKETETEGGCEEPQAFPYMCALPFTVTRAMCNDDADADGEAEAAGELHMCTAALSLLTDMITSFHTYLALHPKDNAHVSVSIQTNQCGPLKLGGSYVAVAKIDKLGRRIVFASVDYVELHLSSASACAVTEAAWLAEGSSIAQLKAVLPYCTILANCKHVKSILSADAQKRVVVHQSKVKEEENIVEKVEPTSQC